MKLKYILIVTAISSVPATFGLGYVKGKSMCNAPNIVHALRDTSQSFAMNAPLVEQVYKAGVRTSIEGSCSEYHMSALRFVEQGRQLLQLDD
ncbi:hypothetical protein [Cochlodiniinecator piscidefendens]|uniref:hypothetical protein n=1 Tax=Cochlodiniinecator piscidefendens TaxID=2715756 RepID=UPI00140CFA80|nr:hypothetical protein [Cochlodiniinecator piscidefendens]